MPSIVPSSGLATTMMENLYASARRLRCWQVSIRHKAEFCASCLTLMYKQLATEGSLLSGAVPEANGRQQTAIVLRSLMLRSTAGR